MKSELRALLMQYLLAPWHNILRPANDGQVNTVEFVHLAQVVQADSAGFPLGLLDLNLLGVGHLATLPLSLNMPNDNHILPPTFPASPCTKPRGKKDEDRVSHPVSIVYQPWANLSSLQ